MDQSHRFSQAEKDAFRPSACSACGAERPPERVRWGHAGTWNGPDAIYWVIGIECPTCTDEEAARKL